MQPDNLLVEGGGEAMKVKVADFGLSKPKMENGQLAVKDLRGTLPYMAPELAANPKTVSCAARPASCGAMRPGKCM